MASRWGNRAHLHHGVDVDGLLSIDDLDHILTSTALRAPSFRVVKGGVTLDASLCTRRARIGSRTVTDLIDAGRVYGHFAGGATIVLQGLHRSWPAVAALCRDLEDRLTHPVQANAYLTPPVAQGLRVHGDAHDVFALQTHGSKQWVVYEGVSGAAEETPTLDVQLRAGDCLYLPKGVRHAARTVEGASLHLTLGVRTVTWADVLGPLVDRSLSDPALSEPLPAGFAREPDALAEEAARRLAGVVQRLREADAADAVARAARRFSGGRAPVLRGQLQQLLAAGDIDGRTVVRRRPSANCSVSRTGDVVTAVLADRTLRLPASAEGALRTALQPREFVAADLGDSLDEAGRVTLVRRLVREGLLEVVGG